MRKATWIFFLSVLFAFGWNGTTVNASTISYVGALTSPDDSTTGVFTFTLTIPGAVVLQTYGFGQGGTDPFLGIFHGTGPTAAIVIDGLANPYGTSMDLSNYGSFTGCPPAIAPTIGGSPQCGDIRMTLPNLIVGDTYTVLLTDGQYIPDAVFDNGTLGEGFSDFTGGVFCNLIINGVDCPNTNGSFALDITTPNAAGVPEPGSLTLLASSLAALVYVSYRVALARRL